MRKPRHRTRRPGRTRPRPPRAPTAHDTQQIAPADTGTIKTAAPDSDEDAVLRELDWDAPPSPNGAAAEVESMDAPAPPRGSKLKWLMAAMVVVAACVIGAVAWIVIRNDANSEAERFRKGLDAYTHKQNDKVATIFSGLVADFPDSENKDTYVFLRDWSHLRSRIYAIGAVAAESIEALASWVKSEAKNPVFAKYKDDVGETYLQVLDERVELAQRDLKPEDPDAIKAELDEAAPYIPGASVIALRNRLAELYLAITRKLLREEVLKALKQLLENPKGDMLERANEEIGQARRELPGIDKDAEVQALMRQILDARRALVAWQDAVVPLEPAADNGEPALWVCTHLEGLEMPPAHRAASSSRRTRRALRARPGHRPGSLGRPRRSRYHHPSRASRLPRRAGAALVLSSDTNTLSAKCEPAADLAASASALPG